jgi:hypothetical protein
VAAVAPAVAAPPALAVAAPHAAVDYYVSATRSVLVSRPLSKVAGKDDGRLPQS